MMQKAKTSEAIGFDFGGTIGKKVEGVFYPFPACLRVIKRLVNKRFGDQSFIVSRVTPEQKIRAEAWLKRNGLFELTGLPPDHVEFCAERHEKAPICTKLGITHFVDDRPEVLSYMTDVPHRFLFQGDNADYETFKHRLIGVHRVNTWEEIESLILGEH